MRQKSIKAWGLKIPFQELLDANIERNECFFLRFSDMLNEIVLKQFKKYDQKRFDSGAP